MDIQELSTSVKHILYKGRDTKTEKKFEEERLSHISSKAEAEKKFQQERHSYIFRKGNWTAVKTNTSDYNYEFYTVQCKEIHFRVKATNDAEIALTSGPSVNNTMLEIYIGAWSNTRSVIKKNRVEPFVAEAETPNILSPDNYTGFWIKWYDGILTVGKENDPKPFLSYNDLGSFEINFFGISTTWGASGEWLLFEESWTAVKTNPSDYNYEFYIVQEKEIHFRVKATNDAEIALTYGPSVSNTMLEIYIGGWENTRSVIRKNRVEPDVAVAQTPNILSPNSYNGFWIKWFDGNLTVGKENDSKPFLSYDLLGAFNINFFGISTTWGASGEWLLCNLPKGKWTAVKTNTSDYNYEFYTVQGKEIHFRVKATNDAEIALTSGPSVSDTMLEIYIGGWENTRSVIRKNRTQPFVAEALTPNILSPDNYTGFWIKWYNGNLSIGKENDPKPFLSYDQSEAFDINFFGISTTWGASGEWLLFEDLEPVSKELQNIINEVDEYMSTVKYQYPDIAHNKNLRVFESLEMSTIEKEFKQFQENLQAVKTGTESKHDSSLDAFETYSLATFKEKKSPCELCMTAVATIQTAIKYGGSNQFIASMIAKLCISQNFAPSHICKGMANLLGMEVIEVIRRSDLSELAFCNFFKDGLCWPHANFYHHWDVKLPSKPKPAHRSFEPPKPGTPLLKVLQISDIHFDPKYTKGANAQCGEPVCCRPEHGKPKNSFQTAGEWGDPRQCDAPKWLIENALKDIAKNHGDIDYIMWTGDIPPHDIWDQTKESNLKVIQEIKTLVNKYFKNVNVYPSVGNHEANPLDSFVPWEYSAGTELDMRWLYDEVGGAWKQWLPSDSYDKLVHGLFYSTLARPGLRIIGINGNFCSRLNFWLLLMDNDPGYQLHWLAKELQAAEDANEKVHIIGHIPINEGECSATWAKQYFRILERYEDTVQAQFYGHTHWDEFQVFYGVKNTSHPTSIGYIAPSITPWEYVNPAYRIYYVDAVRPNATGAVIDVETWRTDLTKANYAQAPVWFKSYSPREQYRMDSLQPKDWDALIKKLKKDDDLFRVYMGNYYRWSSNMPKCDEDCKKEQFCKMKNGTTYLKKYPNSAC